MLQQIVVMKLVKNVSCKVYTINGKTICVQDVCVNEKPSVVNR